MLQSTTTVSEFADWWMKEKPFSVPKNPMRYFGPEISGVVIFRKDQFQAELYIGRPHASAPRHSHPNIDSSEIGIAGLAVFDCDLKDYNKNKTRIHVHPNEMHTAHMGRVGGCFISFQKWSEGVEPTSVGYDWVGEAIDEKHAADISVHKEFV